MSALASESASPSAAIQSAGGLALSTTLPISSARLEICLASLYKSIVRGTTLTDLLHTFCVQLGHEVDSPLVMIGQKLNTGAIASEATSSENALWLEFQRIQERWDGSVASRGIAGTALNAGAPVRLNFSHIDMTTWRSAADKEHVTEGLAFPIIPSVGVYILEIFLKKPLVADASSDLVTLENLSQTLATLLSDYRENEHQRFLVQAMEAAGNSAFITDPQGTILWSNNAFTRLTGYSKQEILGQNPRILQSGLQSIRYYRELWSTIHSGKVWSGETLDRDKDGNLYTIHQTISPITRDGRVTHYISIHDDISRQKRRQSKLELATNTEQKTGLLTRAAFEMTAREVLMTETTHGLRLELIIVSLQGVRRAESSFDPDMEDFLSDVLGERVRRSVPAEHLVGAMGSYEYVALIKSENTSTSSTDKIVESLRQALLEPILFLGNSIDIEMRVGHAQYPVDGSTLEALLQRADREISDNPIARMRHSPEH